MKKRQIKFRAWHNNYCKKITLSEIEPYLLMPHAWVSIDKMKVEQFTGLTDQNGTEIYEGDVLEVKNATEYENEFKGIVFFANGTFCLKRINQHDEAKTHKHTELVRFWNDGMHDHHSLEILCDGYCTMIVTGNIHQNPELLNP